MASHNNGGGSGGNLEPAFAPQAGRWYNLTLGSSFKDNSTKFCTLRYEFKPASIDKNQAGSLHKNKDNRVTVEFNNNQPGKPKVTFEGSSEDYKENDGVLFFDGETFRLERLHRAVKRLRHVRMPGESAAAAAAATASAAPAVSSGIAMEARSPVGKTVKSQSFAKSVPLSVPVEVEKIDIGEPDSPGVKPTTRPTDYHSAPPSSFAFSPEKMATEEDNLHLIFGDDDDNDKADNPDVTVRASHDLDVLSNQNDSEDELADMIEAVNASDDEGDKGLNAAEAIRAAEENAEDDQQQSSSSSESSGSESRSSGSGSGSGSASSSSDSEASDEDSGGDIDI